jgi:hypothetical protein
LPLANVPDLSLSSIDQVYFLSLMLKIDYPFFLLSIMQKASRNPCIGGGFFFY